MHPINQKNFGYNGLSCAYGDGLGNSITGYVVRQIGTYKYVVTPDGSTFYTASLVPALTEDDVLELGQMTFLIQGPNGVEYVKRLYSNTAVTVDDNVYSWTIDESFDGSYVIYSYAFLQS